MRFFELALLLFGAAFSLCRLALFVRAALNQPIVFAYSHPLVARINLRALRVHATVSVTVGEQLQRRLFVFAVFVRVHVQTRSAGAERVIREVTTRMATLNLRPHALFAHRAQKRPTLFLNVSDVVDRFHALNVQHRRLGNPLTTRAVRPERRDGGRFESASRDRAQAAQGRLTHRAARVLARATQPTDGVVGNVRDAVARLVHGDRARLARDELVVIEIAFIVAHGASIDAPIHLDYLVIQLLRFLIVAILEPRSFIEIAPVQKASDGHLRRFNHAQRRLPFLGLSHAGVFFKLGRRHELGFARAIRALAEHLIRASVIVGGYAVTNHRERLRHGASVR